MTLRPVRLSTVCPAQMVGIADRLASGPCGDDNCVQRRFTARAIGIGAGRRSPSGLRESNLTAFGTARPDRFIALERNGIRHVGVSKAGQP